MHLALSLPRSRRPAEPRVLPSEPARLRECPDCGRFHRLTPLSPGTVARCARCHGVLGRGRRDPLGRPLALAVTGLLLLVLAIQMPFMSIDLYGRENAANFTTGALQLDRSGLWELGLVVLAFTVGAPLAKLLCLAWVLLGLRADPAPRTLYVLFRWAERLSPWSMVEVYLLGTFVAYTKLKDLAHVQVGVAVYALGALMLVMAAADWTLDPDAVWERLEARGIVAAPERLKAARQEAARPVSADAAQLLSCRSCGLVSRAHSGESCPRCDAVLRARKPDSLARTWALLAAAAVLYIPANTLPVLTAIRLGRGQPSTILGGVEQLAAAGMWPLAVLVFFASITVPMLKLIGLSIMLISVHRRARGHLHDRTVLYRIVDAIGRWSMIDVFMISILVGLVRLGFIASVTPGPGAIAFAAVVILTMLASISFDPRLMWDAAGRNPGHGLAERGLGPVRPDRGRLRAV